MMSNQKVSAVETEGGHFCRTSDTGKDSVCGLLVQCSQCVYKVPSSTTTSMYEFSGKKSVPSLYFLHWKQWRIGEHLLWRLSTCADCVVLSTPTPCLDLWRWHCHSGTGCAELPVHVLSVLCLHSPPPPCLDLLNWYCHYGTGSAGNSVHISPWSFFFLSHPTTGNNGDMWHLFWGGDIDQTPRSNLFATWRGWYFEKRY